MTRTFGWAVGFLLIVLFFAGVATECARAESPRPAAAAAR
jgi:hypothetical protein